ncbi:gamma-glutamylcyclotransferase family protein [Catenovulum sediminis]|uniref:Putative gamma-glutamylcyclotransferase n=1 Tax=Catenovulum sediminis TaxID=1740262 RepID=A0ABV1RCK6_9ALTE|nr:gamma-glutamylcyclotransferase family protein [Catenovulum sediminis]
MHVFTYGSLMYSEVWQRVVSEKYQSETARIYGFCRKKVVNEHYPVLKLQDNAICQGRLYLNVTLTDIHRLDDFEGEYYDRVTRLVSLSNGHQVKAQVYLLNSQFSHICSHQNWSTSEFEKTGLNQFLAQYKGFNPV